MILEEIELGHIDFENDTYRISEDLECAPVRDSLREIGQLNPVLLLERHPRKQIVCGFRRLQALKQLNRRGALARILDDRTIDSRKAFDVALWENLSHRQFSPLEKARVLFKLRNLFKTSEHEIVQRYLPCLGLKPHQSVLHTYLRLNGLHAGPRKCFAEGKLTLSSMESLAEMPHAVQERLALCMERMQLSASMQKKVLVLLADLGAMRDVQLGAPLNDEEVQDVLHDSRLSPFQKGEKVHAYLYRKRYPRVSQAFQSFMERKKSIDLPGSIRIIPGPFFETPDLRVEFDASTAERFRELAAELNKAAQNPELDRLFDIC
jgi:hypothetical protein